MAKYTTNLTLTTQHFSNDYLLLRMKIKLNKQQYTPQRIDKRSKIIKNDVLSDLTCMQYVSKRTGVNFRVRRDFLSEKYG